MNITTFTGQLLKEYNRKLEKVIHHKLKMLEYQALEQKEYRVYEILRTATNIVEVKSELEKYGYDLELENPHPEFTCDESIIKATIETDKIKLLIKKKILEV